MTEEGTTLPGGIDMEAKENDTSPVDMAAHVGGLIAQRIDAILQEKA